MAEAREAGHVPDLAIARVVVVRIELACVEEPAARRAAIVILAAAMHRHDLANEGGGTGRGSARATLRTRGSARGRVAVLPARPRPSCRVGSVLVLRDLSDRTRSIESIGLYVRRDGDCHE